MTSKSGYRWVICCLLLAMPWGCTNRKAAERAPLREAELDAGLEPFNDTESRQPWFEDVASELGLDFTHKSGDPTDYFMPKNMGSGAALFDANRDGLLDIYCVQQGRSNGSESSRFFLQQADGTFIDATAESGLGLQGRGTGVAAGDVNNDGLVDLLVTFFGDVRLMLNLGEARFADITDSSGIENPLWGTSAAFTDVDRDGWLDLVITNYLAYSGSRTCYDASGQRDFCSPNSFAGTASKLFRNISGDQADSSSDESKTGERMSRVKFADETVASGLAARSAPGLGVACADFDGDGWQDILIANDGQPNHLWINMQDGTFEEQAALRGLAFSATGQPFADMGIATGDVDHNGLLDVYITHLTEELHSLWLQQSPGFYTDSTAQHGLTRPTWRSTGFGVCLIDFDHDGWLDLAQVNGRVRSTATRLGNSRRSAASDESQGPGQAFSEFWRPYCERNQLFAGKAGGLFVDISESTPALTSHFNMGRGLASGDFDNDGDVDLLLTPIDAPAQLLRNVAPKRGHWLSIRAVLPDCGGRDAFGATIMLKTGDTQRVAIIQAAASYQSSNDPRAHFGLGPYDSIDHVDVEWPNGTQERFSDVELDQQITLRCGTGIPIQGTDREFE